MHTSVPVQITLFWFLDRAQVLFVGLADSEFLSVPSSFIAHDDVQPPPFPRQPQATPRQRVHAHQPYNFRAIRNYHYDLGSRADFAALFARYLPHAQR